MSEPDGFDLLSPREQADVERKRNDEQRLWFVEFRAKWLLEKGIIEVRDRPGDAGAGSRRAGDHARVPGAASKTVE